MAGAVSDVQGVEYICRRKSNAAQRRFIEECGERGRGNNS